MRLIRFIFFFIIFSLGLTSCSTLSPPQQQSAQNKVIPLEKRKQNLSSIESWNLKGLIAVRQAEKSGTANLQWQQRAQNFHISLFGPLGSHSVELNGSPGKVEMASADGKKASASSAEALLAQQMGWKLPVSNMRYWVRGLPVPGVAFTQKLDSYNHVVALQQSGWSIQYPRYTSVRGIDLPDKIFLNNPQLSVKIAISQWSL